jgi:thiamine-monophosphate kinase
LTAIGEVAVGAEIRRSGARPGDDVWVSGTIGDAYLGLGVLRSDAFAGLAPAFAEALIARYRLPEPRVTLGPALAGIANAMIDVSDGLVADLGHICETSGCAATLAIPEIPFSRAALSVLAMEWDNPVSLVTGGDDYELLFCAPPAARDTIAEIAASLGLQISKIGRIEPGSGVRLVDETGREVAVEAAGWRHF